MKRIFVYSGRLNSSYNQLTLSLLREGRRKGWRFVWLNPLDAQDEHDRVAKILEIVKPSGIVSNDISAIADLLPKGFPVVLVDSRRKSSGAPVIRHDNASFGVAAADALLGQGSEFAVFGLADRKCYWSVVRERAFAERIQAAGFTCHRSHFDMWLDNPYFALDDIQTKLAELKRPVSIFAVCDWVADVVLMAAESLGWRCPQDFRLVGVDDDELICTTAAPSLSSIHVPSEEEGGRFAKAMADLLAGNNPTPVFRTCHTRIVTRLSTSTFALSDPVVAKAVSYAEKHLAESLRGETLAAAANCSLRTLQIRILKTLGRSIKEEIAFLRQNAALKLIKETKMPIAEIARTCGFCSPSHLGIHIRKATGQNPLAIRTTNKGYPAL